MDGDTKNTTFPPDYAETELVLGLVGAVGTDLSSIEKIITERLAQFRYTANPVRLSSLIRTMGGLTTTLKEAPACDRYRSYMDAGSEARRTASRGDVLALSAISAIHGRRTKAEPLGPTVHILRSLKHPDEVNALRSAYGGGFVLIGVYSSKKMRLKHLCEDEGMTVDEANELIRRDEDEPNRLGQRTRDTFERADAFVSLHAPDSKEQLWRILDLLFGKPDLTPFLDEHAMFMAYSASLRSADLSRQVGAVILSSAGELIATGANDVPAFGGGLYWPSEHDQRDHKKGFDSNERRRDDIVLAVMKRLTPDDERSEGDLLEHARDVLKGTGLLDLTEFGRAVHAEMEALMCCARVGVSPSDGTLYTTTFPCHNCAKHIIAAGLRRVVYVEPYPKSLAAELHPDELVLDPEKTVEDHVAFVPFVGIGPRRFFDLFSMKLSSGRTLERKKHGEKVEWKRDSARLRIPMLPASYLEIEKLAVATLVDLVGGKQ